MKYQNKNMWNVNSVIMLLNIPVKAREVVTVSFICYHSENMWNVKHAWSRPSKSKHLVKVSFLYVYITTKTFTLFLIGR